MAKKKILIAEDDADTRLGLSARLKASGYETVVARDGVTAIMAAQRENLDLIILDLGLPGGDGIGVLKRLKQLVPTRAIPVIVVSAHDPFSNEPLALKEGAANFFSKPADSEALLAAIRRLLKEDVASGGVAGPKRILIVEDDSETRTWLGTLFKAQGYETVFATDGVTAVMAAQKENPDIVLLDLGLPGGDGFTILERFEGNQKLAAVPIIVLSGRDLAAHKDRALKAGAKKYFQKPADPKELLAAIKEVLG
jgi:DNA-binding response OmpR family regulator